MAERRATRPDCPRYGRGGRSPPALRCLPASQWLHAPSVEYLVPLIVATAATRGDGGSGRAARLRRWALASLPGAVAASLIAIAGAASSSGASTHDWEGWRRDASARGLTRAASARSTTRPEIGARRAPCRARGRRRSSRDRAFDAARAARRTRPGRGGVVVYRARQRVRVGRRLRAADRPVRDGTSDRRDAVLSRAAGHAAARRRPRRRRCRCSTPPRRPTDSSRRSRSRIADRDRTRASSASCRRATPRPPDLSSLRRRDTCVCSTCRADPLVAGRGLAADRRDARARAPASRSSSRSCCFVIGVWRGTRTISRSASAALAVGLACDGARSAQPVLESRRGSSTRRSTSRRGAVRSPATPARWRRRARSCCSACSRSSVGGATSHVALGSRRHDAAARRRPRSVSAARARARRADSAARRRRVALADLGDPALSRRRVGAARRAPRRVPPCSDRVAALPPWVAPLDRDARRGARAGRLGGARPMAVVVHDSLDRRDRTARARAAASRFVILSASTVAALGATTLVWGRTARGRVDAGGARPRGLSQVDSVAATLLQRFGAESRRRRRRRRRAVAPASTTSRPTSPRPEIPIALSAWPTDSGAGRDVRDGATFRSPARRGRARSSRRRGGRAA